MGARSIVEGRGDGGATGSNLLSRRRAATPGTDTPAGLPVRRQWGRLAVGLSIALLGGWLFAALYLSAGRRVSVVVVARDVQAYQVIERDDLATERVAAGDKVDTISADEIDDVVDHVAKTNLYEGTVLSEGQLARSRGDVIPDGWEEVGAELNSGSAPRGVESGDPVRVTITSDTGGEGTELDSVCGEVTHVGPMDDRTGERKVDVIVPSTDAEEVSAAAHDGRLALSRRSSHDASCSTAGSSQSDGDDGDVEGGDGA